MDRLFFSIMEANDREKVPLRSHYESPKCKENTGGIYQGKEEMSHGERETDTQNGSGRITVDG